MTKLNNKDKISSPNDSHPKIIESEDRKILEKKPPNERILFFNIIENDNEMESKND